jgi:ribosomal protein S18 acetylase RimI-like enzyme
MSREPASDRVSLEPISRDIAAIALREVFEAMSPASRYLRFHSPVPRLTSSLERALSDVDGSRHRAWRAVVGERTVGISRLVTGRSGEVELAVEVADDFHGRGIGKKLSLAALREAHDAGVSFVQVIVHPENRSGLNLFRNLGARLSFRDGTFEGVIPVGIDHWQAA